MVVIGLGVFFDGTALVSDRSFAQNIMASLLVLPIGVAVGVVVGTFLQRHTLRFQARQWGDRLRDRAILPIFGFIVYLNRDCDFSIDLSGPTSSKFVKRARKAVLSEFLVASWKKQLPADFEQRMYRAANDFLTCFAEARELRLAFPRAFDLMEELEAIVRGAKSDSRSFSSTTTLILLQKASEIVRELE